MLGEQAFINKQKRLAHCIAVSDHVSLCIVLGKDYNSIFGPLQMSEEERKRSYIEMQILTEPSLRPLSRVVCVNLARKMYPIHKNLFRKGDEPVSMYFIVSGQVVLWDQGVGLEQFQKKKRSRGDERRAQPEDPNVKKLKSMENREKGQPDEQKSLRNEIMICGPGRMVGEEGLFNPENKRLYTATADSECVVYEVRLDRMNHVCRENPSLLNFFRQRAADKISLVGRMGLNKLRVNMAKQNYLKTNPSSEATSSTSQLPPVVIKPVTINFPIQRRSFVETREQPSPNSFRQTYNAQNSASPRTSAFYQNTQSFAFEDLVTRTKQDFGTFNPNYPKLQRIDSLGLVSNPIPKYKHPSLTKVPSGPIASTILERKEQQSKLKLEGASSHRASVLEDTNSIIHTSMNANKAAIYKQLLRRTSNNLMWDLPAYSQEKQSPMKLANSIRLRRDSQNLSAKKNDSSTPKLASFVRRFNSEPAIPMFSTWEHVATPRGLFPDSDFSQFPSHR